jgi:hypothetical protein
MSPVPDPARREAVLQTVSYPEPNMRDELSVVIAGHRQVGSGVAELWCGSALLGILHEEHGGIVLRLESHASGPLTVSAVALERALAEVREGLAVASGRARAEGITTTKTTDSTGESSPLAMAVANRHDQPRARPR